MKWTLSGGCAPDDIADNGNRFLIGNGYLGVRGTLEEHTKAELAAVNLAGIYDRVGGGWREPLNAPNPFYTCLREGEVPLAVPKTAPLSHSQCLDFRSGVLRRQTQWKRGGAWICISAERFASLADPHVLCMRYTVVSDSALTLTLAAGIDGDVWDIHGPHYGSVRQEAHGDTLLCTAQVHDGGAAVAVARKSFLSSPEETIAAGASALSEGFALSLRPGVPCRLTSLCAVYTSKDAPDPAASAAQALLPLMETDYDALLDRSRAAWEAVWETSAVKIDGDEEAERAVNYSVYQLNCIAPRRGGALSIPARGLSGQTYKGAVFWDSEMFLLDYFLATQPAIARSLIRYRIETLPGALEKAASYGYEGAFYAWESQEGGFDACSDYNVTDVFTGRPVRTYFRDKQVHISAAVVWALMRYLDVTGDVSILAEGGARVALECARFYRSRLVLPLNRGRYELHDVIGPDEYHERVNNNAYTNRMAKFTFESALYAASLLRERAPAAYAALDREMDIASLAEQIRDALSRLYVPQPGENGLVEQFDGYFALEDAVPDAVRARLRDPREYWGGGTGAASDTQVIKQADVVAMLELFHGEYDEETLRRNWRYYEPRTEHGSSLSACMYALLACRFGEPDLAYPFFMKSAGADIVGGGKQWAGLVYIGGTHPAAAGGAWKTLAQGFGGLTFGEEGPALSPQLPSRWKGFSFRFVYRGALYRAVITREGGRLERIKEMEGKENA